MKLQKFKKTSHTTTLKNREEHKMRDYLEIDEVYDLELKNLENWKQDLRNLIDEIDSTRNRKEIRRITRQMEFTMDMIDKTKERVSVLSWVLSE